MLPARSHVFGDEAAGDDLVSDGIRMANKRLPVLYLINCLWKSQSVRPTDERDLIEKARAEEYTVGARWSD
jgi:hypothetical protein